MANFAIGQTIKIILDAEPNKNLSPNSQNILLTKSYSFNVEILGIGVADGKVDSILGSFPNSIIVYTEKDIRDRSSNSNPTKGEFVSQIDIVDEDKLTCNLFLEVMGCLYEISGYMIFETST